MKKRLDGTRSAPFTRLKLFAHFERINKPGCDHLHWQLLTAVCPLRNYATLLLSHLSLRPCQDGGYREQRPLLYAILQSLN